MLKFSCLAIPLLSSYLATQEVFNRGNLMNAKINRIIAVFNQSGGVSKSTLTMNLGYHLQQRFPNRVLLVDMDPQASLTTFMGLEPDELETTVYHAVVEKAEMPIWHEKIHGMDFVPSNIELSSADLKLANAIMREFRLKNAIAPIQDNYDFILIDCPPSLGMPSTQSLVAATHLVVPVQCQYKSFKATDVLLETVLVISSEANKDLKIACFVPTMFDGRTTQESRAFAAIKDQLGTLAPITKPIPKSIAFADAVERHLPLALYNSKHPAVAIIDDIAASLAKL
jgi:chromosome partitioning protein